LLSILAVAQRTAFPDVTFAPLTSNSVSFPSSARVFNGRNFATIPVGGTSPQGALNLHSTALRIHCDKLLADFTPEFVLMVARPYRTKMIEGFIIRGSYEYSTAGKIKTGKIENITRFDDFGKPYTPNQQEVRDILKRYPPGSEPVGGVMRFNLPQPPQ
jgi:hypothetical protein